MTPSSRERRLRVIARIVEARKTAEMVWSEEERQDAAERLGLGDWMPELQEEMEFK